MTEQDKTPIQRAGRHRPAVALFVLLTLFTLGADLLSKHFAFKHVAGEELKLSRDADDGTTVVQVRDPDTGEWISSPRLREDSPASARVLFDQSEFGEVVVPKVLSLKLTINTGAVFGIGKGAQWFFIAVSLVAVIFISIVFARSSRTDRWLHICLALILAGAIGNLYDRMLYNGVRDMCFLFPGVDLPFGLNWPGGGDQPLPLDFQYRRCRPGCRCAGPAGQCLASRCPSRQGKKGRKTRRRLTHHCLRFPAGFHQPSDQAQIQRSIIAAFGMPLHADVKRT